MIDSTPVNPAKDLLLGLNSSQQEAVEAVDGPVLVVAGPGSGKTAVLTRRIAHMVTNGLVRPESILAVTFTNKAAGEMRQRVTDLATDEEQSATNKVWIHTFHSFCARVLRVEHIAAGLPSAYTILDANDSKSVLKEIIKKSNPETEIDPKYLKELGRNISRFKNGGFVTATVDFSKAYEEYCLRLKRMGALDFDDLIARTWELFDSNDSVRAKYSKKFSHIMVDEYQDTNPMQYKLLKSLTRESANICVVGDMDQSIYGFRMATPKVMEDFLNDFPQTRIVKLDTNYRSTKNILDVAYSVIEGNESAHRAILDATKDCGDKVKIVMCDDPKEEARFVSDSIRKIDANLSVGVLMRTNAQSRALEAALPAAGVSFETVGTLRFYDRSEIKDVFSYIRLALNTRDSVAFARAVSAPKRGLGSKSIAEVTTDAIGTDLILSLRDMLANGTLTGQKAVKWSSFLNNILDVQQCLLTYGLVDTINLILKQGLEQHARDTDDETTNRVENLYELVSYAQEFVARAPTHEDGTYKSNIEISEDFITSCSLESGEDSSVTKTKVRAYLMSVHAAKGKEFDVVYVIGAEEGMFPHARLNSFKTDFLKVAASDDAEERRLFFVAATRAKTKLFFTHTLSRMHGASWVRDIAVSRYLDNAPVSAVERIDRSGNSPTQRKVSSYGPGDRSKAWGKGPGATVPTPTSNLRLSLKDIHLGCSVVHIKFGKGTITSIVGETDDASITIKFGSDLRIFKLSATPLTT